MAAMARTPIPPTTPPTMAPTGVLLLAAGPGVGPADDDDDKGVVTTPEDEDVTDVVTGGPGAVVGSGGWLLEVNVCVVVRLEADVVTPLSTWAVHAESVQHTGLGPRAATM